MAIISENLQQSLTALLRMANEIRQGPPEVTIPKDEDRLLDGNQVTAFLQLYMQGRLARRPAADHARG